jgi:Pentapeptide repeats (8 copies)
MAGLLWVIAEVPPWLVHHDSVNLSPREAARITAERRNVLATLAALGAALSLWYTHQRHQLDRDANRTDRYTAAIEQLGSDKLEVRLGGIYALERLMRDSARDHPTIVEALAAFIRTHAPLDPPSPPQVPRDRRVAGRAVVARWRNGPAAVQVDVQAALTVLGRNTDATRTNWGAPPVDLRHVRLSGYNFRKFHLSQVSLYGADLEGADLEGAWLISSNLIRTNLYGAYLKNAILYGALLQDADLEGADLEGARLDGARLDGANLAYTHLRNTNLLSTNLEGADLRGADLDGATVSEEQLRGTLR